MDNMNKVVMPRMRDIVEKAGCEAVRVIGRELE